MRCRERRCHRHVGKVCRRSMVSMPSPAAITLGHTDADGRPKQITHRLARRVDRALSEPSGASQVRCTPVILPERSVTAAIMAGQVSVGPSSGL